MNGVPGGNRPIRANGIAENSAEVELISRVDWETKPDNFSPDEAPSSPDEAIHTLNPEQ